MPLLSRYITRCLTAESAVGYTWAIGLNGYRGLPGGSNSVVECDLAKVEVAGSNPVSRSKIQR